MRATSSKDESASFSNDIQSAKIDPDISSHETGEFLDVTKALKRRQCEDKTTQVKGEGVSSLLENVAKGLIAKYNLPEDRVQSMLNNVEEEDLKLMQEFLNQENVLLKSFEELLIKTEALLQTVRRRADSKGFADRLRTCLDDINDLVVGISTLVDQYERASMRDQGTVVSKDTVVRGRADSKGFADRLWTCLNDISGLVVDIVNTLLKAMQDQDERASMQDRYRWTSMRDQDERTTLNATTQLKVKKGKRDKLKNVVFSSCDSATMSSSLTDEDKKHLENFKKFFSLFCSHKNFLDEMAVKMIYCNGFLLVDGFLLDNQDKDSIEYIKSTLVTIFDFKKEITDFKNELNEEIGRNTMGKIDSIIAEFDKTVEI